MSARRSATPRPRPIVPRTMILRHDVQAAAAAAVEPGAAGDKRHATLIERLRGPRIGPIALGDFAATVAFGWYYLDRSVYGVAAALVLGEFVHLLFEIDTPVTLWLWRRTGRSRELSQPHQRKTHRRTSKKIQL